ncbi:E3 ubiquitin-protein ligase MGRN1 isoform X2 [Bombyx mori]|uniref:RING-type E3 ubiquitin transferase n=1 Tax=Bombyx mori TaxID=7091 RepID=A0A8R2GD70_BOMMO|nr:E3 ubiquitin-protein ligase MGRN1 isoform X2 [Bombyx mori]
MGVLASRQNPGLEDADIISNHAYKYPPRSGNYFGSHFIMGGERFDTPQPEAYLFGENADLNFLGSRPTPFPYPPPQSNEPTKTLKSLVNIRKESLRFIRCPEPLSKLADNQIGDGVMKSPESNGKGTYYNIEFTFDCDARCAITVHYFCTEEVTPAGVVYYPRDPTMSSQTYHYKKGANQQFCQISHVFDPSKYSEEDLLYNADKELIPIAIYCVVDEGQDEIRQSHTTIAVVEKHSDGTYVLKALKQKLFVDGLCYLLQEIYGIENKNLDSKPTSDSETEEGGSECVICMCDTRDTLILPCRHLCLCNSCADSLRYQANNCPICRAPFRALLQIRALQRRTSEGALPAGTGGESLPPGYEPVSLIEALNGPHPARSAAPTLTRTAPAIASPDTDTASQAAEILNRCNIERSSSTSLGSSGSRKGKSGSKDDVKTLRSTPHALTPEFRMSVLLAREEEAKRADEKTAASSPLLHDHKLMNGENKFPSSPDMECGAEASCSEQTGAEPDADAERLSPLLTHTLNNIRKPVVSRACSVSSLGAAPADPAGDSALRLSAPALAHIDDIEEPHLRSDGAESPAPAEDSDYFTPEDTTTTILTLPKAAKHLEPLNNGECTPQRWALPHHVTSLPGTPLSQSSVRSSGESYSSTSSTRQLLTAPPPRAC